MFDPNQYEPATGAGQQLPVGDHPVVISGACVKPTKAGDGSYLELELTVVEGPQQGKTGCERLNLLNSNQKAVEIAVSQLTAICWCTGMMQPFDFQTDCSPLFNKIFRIEVVPQSGENGDKGYTQIRKYKSYEGDSPAKGKQPPQIRPYGGGGQSSNPAMGGPVNPAQPPVQAQQQFQQPAQAQEPVNPQFQPPVQAQPPQQPAQMTQGQPAQGTMPWSQTQQSPPGGDGIPF